MRRRPATWDVVVIIRGSLMRRLTVVGVCVSIVLSVVTTFAQPTEHCPVSQQEVDQNPPCPIVRIPALFTWNYDLMIMSNS